MTGEGLCHILGILNSKLISWYFKHCIGTTSGVGTNRWLKYTLEQIPIVPISQRLEELALLISSKYDAQTDNEIDELVCKLYQLDEEETSYIL